MNCKETKPLFSSYLDGALTGTQMHGVSHHMNGCRSCAAEYRALGQMQTMVASLKRPVAPADLALKIKASFSQQRSMTLERRMQGVAVRLENAMNAVMLPATAGLVTAVVMIGLLIGFFALPHTMTVSNDVPTSLYTPPKLSNAPFSDNVSISAENPVVIEAMVDSKGRLQDYRIVSGHDTQQIRQQLDRMLIFTTFEPATSFGEPADGKVVLSFGSLNVSIKG